MSLSLPCNAKKKALYTHYKEFNNKELREEMGEIVSIARNIPINKAKVVKVLRRNEVVILMSRMGDSLSNLNDDDFKLIKEFEGKG